MKLPFRQLTRHLQQELAGFYLIAGEEPLLIAQALAQIREAARRRGFDDRELHIVERGFRWAEVEADMDNLSLFSSRRMVELRLPSPRPGDAGARVIRSLAERRDPDRLILLAVNAKLDAAASRSAWLRCIEKNGIRIDIWPVEREELPRWIANRASGLGLQLSIQAADLLADRVEGNLLAADQELEKLALTSENRSIDETVISDVVANSARFDVFRLTDAVIAGDSSRAFRVLGGLRAEGVQPVLVCWALSRELGLLTKLQFSSVRGESIDNALSRHGVWRRRQAGVKQALKRFDWSYSKQLLAKAAEADKTIKGVTPGDSWQALTALVIAAMGHGRRSRPIGV